MRRVPTIALLSALAFGIAAVWLLVRNSAPPPENLPTKLKGSTFSSRELPEGFTAAGTKLIELQNRGSHLIYVYLRGPDDRNRIKYEVFADPSSARSSFREGEAALNTQRLNARLSVEFPAYCADYSPGIECYALIDGVVVAGESLVLGEITSGQLDHARKLLFSGIAHLRRVSMNQHS